MATSIADLFVKVTGDVSGAINDLTDVDKKIGSLSASMQAAAPIGYALAGASAAVGAAFVTSVGQASDFEKQINGIKSVMSPDEVNTYGDAVRNLALVLGKDTVFSSSEAAKAIETMIKAGVPLPDILNGAARSALDLASATGTDVTKASELASKAMSAFGLSGSDLPRIMNTISNVSNATATSVGGLSQGISDAGATAAQFGLSFEDTALTLGIFAQNGLTAETAGTGLKTMLSGLTPNTKEQTQVMRDLGLITDEGGNAFFDATGKVKSMSEVAGILQTALANLTPVQKATTLEILFGRDGMQAAGIAAKEGSAGFDKYSEAVDKMGGTAVAAAQRNAGLEGSLKAMGGSFEAIQITIGTLFLPVLTQLVNGVTSVLNGFLTLDPGIQTAIVALVGIAGAVAGLSGGFILLYPVVTALGPAFTALGGILAAAALPVTALVAAAALLYAAWQTNFGGIRDVTQQVWEALQPAFTNIGNFIVSIKDTLAPVFAALGAAIGPLLPVLSDLANQWLSKLPALIKATGDEFNTLSGWIQALWARIQELIATPQVQAFFAALGAAAQGVGPALSAIGTAFGNVRQTVGDFLSWLSSLDIWKSLIDSASAVAGKLGEPVGNFLTFIKDSIGGIPKAITGLGDLWKPFIDGAWAIGTEIGKAFGNFLTFIKDSFSGIPKTLTGLGDLWKGFTDSAWSIGTEIGKAFGNFMDFVGEQFGKIPKLVEWGMLWKSFTDSAWEIGTEIGKAFENFMTFIGEQFGKIPKIVDWGELWKGFTDSAWNIGTEIGKAFENFLTFIDEKIKGIPDMIKEIKIFDGIIDQAKAIFGAIATAIDPIRTLLANTFGNIGSWIASGTTPGVTPGDGATTPAIPSTGSGTGNTAPLINIGTLIVSNEAEKQAFLQDMANAIYQATTRVTAPPSTGPQVVLG